MVNKAEQPIEEPVQESTDNTTTDITEEFAGVDTPPEGTTDTLEAAPEVTEEATAPPAAETAGQQLPLLHRLMNLMKVAGQNLIKDYNNQNKKILNKDNRLLKVRYNKLSKL